jgi:hypothetical protein
MFLGKCPCCMLQSPVRLLIKRQVRQIPFCGTRTRNAFETAGWLSRIWVEDHRQPGDGTLIKLPFAAHVTNPGREVRNHDQFLSQPGEIGDVSQMHHSGRTFTARERIRGRRGECGECLRIVHFILNDFCPATLCVSWLITCHSSGGQ